MERSAGVILFKEKKEDKKRERKYLLLKYKYKTEFWGFAKGLIEKGEKEEETALREVEEETGLKKIKLRPGFKEREKYFYKREGKTVYKEVVWFLGEVLDKSAGKVSGEHLELKWCSFEEALKLLKFKNSKELLKKAEEHLKKENSLSD